MKLTPMLAPLVLGALSIVASTGVFARDLCNRDDMARHIDACLNIGVPSDYQKGGLEDLIKARFCGKGDLARDGMFRCRGDDPDAVKNIMGCGAPAVLELAVNLISENDPRKPAECKP
ncbi:MAG: hypothetical protein ABIW48_04885 [Burkholderiales bacterium]